MHEMSVAQNIFEIVRKNVPEGSEEKVSKIHLKVGELSGIVPDSLLFCIDILKEESDFKNVSIEIEQVPITAHCQLCGKNSQLEYGVFFCPNCQSTSIELLTGRELNIVDIELND
jgi:hydrogenase nickel incorporation protein HypA/HybF